MTDEKKLQEDQIPKPTGYHLLVALPEIKETFAAGLVKAETTIRDEELATMVVTVVDMGPDAYKDANRFPSGPYCKIGDKVLIRAYSGTRFKIHGREFFRIINDDSVEAIVDNSDGYSRI